MCLRSKRRKGGRRLAVSPSHLPPSEQECLQSRETSNPGLVVGWQGRGLVHHRLPGLQDSLAGLVLHGAHRRKARLFLPGLRVSNNHYIVLL